MPACQFDVRKPEEIESPESLVRPPDKSTVLRPLVCGDLPSLAFSPASASPQSGARDK
jgi:hypothetical protein